VVRPMPEKRQAVSANCSPGGNAGAVKLPSGVGGELPGQALVAEQVNACSASRLQRLRSQSSCGQLGKGIVADAELMLPAGARGCLRPPDIRQACRRCGPSRPFVTSGAPTNNPVLEVTRRSSRATRGSDGVMPDTPPSHPSTAFIRENRTALSGYFSGGATGRRSACWRDGVGYAASPTSWLLQFP
jgi:hypothetical protein